MFWLRRNKRYSAQGVYTVAAGNSGEETWQELAGLFRNDGASTWLPKHGPLKLTNGIAQRAGSLYEASTIYGETEKVYLREFDSEQRALSFDVYYLDKDGQYRDQPNESFAFQVHESLDRVRLEASAAALGAPKLPRARLGQIFEHFPVRGTGIVGDNAELR